MLPKRNNLETRRNGAWNPVGKPMQVVLTAKDRAISLDDFRWPRANARSCPRCFCLRFSVFFANFSRRCSSQQVREMDLFTTFAPCCLVGLRHQLEPDDAADEHGDQHDLRHGNRLGT